MEPLEYEVRNRDSLSMVARILSVADYEAAAITQQASYQAAMITRQVAYEATGIREAARQEADQIRQQAVAQAAAVRQAAEREAAQVRTAVMSMQTELSDFAARIEDTFPNLAVARLPPAQRLAVSPAASPPARPAAKPHAVSDVRPAGKPTRQPGGRSAGPSGSGRPGSGRPGSGRRRQAAAMTFAVIATSALFLVTVALGVMEIHLHGFGFFIFRSTGTGETGPHGLPENQGPGQLDAPKPAPSHVKLPPGPRTTVPVHKSQ
jgi:hypothetical protein